MRFVVPRSEIYTDDAGWTWLQAVATSTRARHTVGTFFLALAIVGTGATWILLPSPVSVPATVAVAGAAVWLLVGIVFGAGSRVAWSDIGLYIQDGGRAAQIGWTAIAAVTAVPTAGGRWRVRIDDGHHHRTTRAPFDAPVVRRWLALTMAEASRRQLDPVAVNEGAGFTSGRDLQS